MTDTLNAGTPTDGSRGDRSPAVAACASFGRTVGVAKPWGHEALFADGTHGYVGKLIFVRAGESLSLQLHAQKDETLTVVFGQARLEHGEDPARLVSRTLRPGDVVHLPATVLHRVTAVGDLLFAEASTAAPGWREDVVRFADRYGREGTTKP
jgi:mannose-6-phosphate isomerase-like protein (cupin superfamily)